MLKSVIIAAVFESLGFLSNVADNVDTLFRGGR